MDNLVYPLTTDSDWRDWSTNTARLLTAPGANLGVSTELTTAFDVAASAFSSALATAREPETRSLPTIQAKDTALKNLRTAAIPVVAILRTNPALNAFQRSRLGVRSIDRTPTPAPVPAAAPAVTAFMTGPQSLRVEAMDPLAITRRARPKFVRQIAIFTQQGPAPAGDPGQWPVAKLAGRTTTDLFFPSVMDGTTVWVACAYVNSRNERGPLSVPVSVRLAGGGVQGQVAASTPTDATTQPMKIAA